MDQDGMDAELTPNGTMNDLHDLDRTEPRDRAAWPWAVAHGTLNGIHIAKSV